jgi:cellulose synthase/poly-beta-1,6-N-acetylglucosamine synthase-like glycosyltransferase
MSTHPRVSIIIPFYKNKQNLLECVTHCQKLNYPNFEIIIVANTEPIITGDKIRWLIIKDVAHGAKKDAGVAVASGELCAFIDDDAFPHQDWLKNAVKYFEDANVGAVCGPGIACPKETIMEKASSAIWASPFGAGPARYRYVPTRKHFVVGEAPGYNLIVRRSLMIKIGGIGINLRSGDDAILSEKIRRSGKKIIYAPDVIVYHHRRPLFLPLLKQVMTYGMHRGFFLKRFPQTSQQHDITFALPLLHFVAIMMLVTSLLLFPQLAFLVSILLTIDLGGYLIVGFISGLLVSKSFIVAVLTSIGIPLVHFTYAAGYLYGLLVKELGEKPSY